MVLAGVAMLAGTATGLALASEVECGAVITRDTTLDADLQDCPGDGIVIGADGVTLDLGGHVIDGDGLRGDGDSRGDLGVDDSGGFDRLRVLNGTVRQFDEGVEVTDAQEASIQLLTVEENGIAIGFTRANGSRIEDSFLNGNGSGVHLLQSNDNLIRRNHADDNGGTGIETFSSARNTIDGNETARNGGRGIGVRDTSSATEVSRNVTTDNGSTGISTDGPDNVVFSNEASRNKRSGIQVGGERTVLVQNTAAGNGESGLFLAGSPGVRVAGNTASGNFDTGIDASGFADDGRFLRNTARSNGLDGISVDSSDRVTVKGNLAEDNGTRIPGVVGRGIVIDECDDAVIADNAAFGHARSGIDIASSARPRVERNVTNGNPGDGLRYNGLDGRLANNQALGNLGTGVNVVFGSGNLLQRNLAKQNGQDGIALASSTTGNVLTLNRVSGNEDDGIDSDSAQVALTSNLANQNGDLGIEAEPGTTDGGGNRARANGNTLQCSNVSCR
jgi:parallel beta-helix repeat protein